MPFDFVLPDLGEGITEGEVRKWLVKEGDVIEEHQTILEIETDKAIVEVPSPKKGRVLKINKDIGDMAKVGEILMTIAEEGEAVEEKPEAEERPKSVSVVGVLPEEEEILATPAVRALAKELGVKIETIKGSGPGGSITKEDVIEASEKAKKIEDQYGTVERMPIRGLRRTIAKNLIASQKTTAFVTGMDEADITELWNLREREKKALLDKGIHLTFLPFFIKAVHHALAEHPLLNASVDEEKEEIIIKKYYNIGIAVDTPDGLMVPVVKDVDKKTILELAREIQDLSLKARDRKIKLEEMKGSTFTITNYGHFGGTFATPIINYPDVAILGTGKISEKPWVKDSQIVIRKILPLSLTFDHRVTDGVDSARFLSKVIQYLEDPALLFIESA
ncbi:MAG: 2-oxo acid dehydrogenase subunit E2 [Nitrospirae bacterium]|nr:2-oxo acid dehydrogenase subunit E2 [Nitrospirota bacterium]MCL5063440.1 2-oxo acid dehydrogenase subunit E2 [Nitrospirota bacterium]MDA8340185.1 dihydrolipoamide acetyltransferase family protein [Nitrospiraceae bacterium]